MIDEPLASLGFPDDPLLKATAFTWVNLNRVAVGHSDGSVSLWSIIPQRLLQRHQIHGGYIIDMCSGYPSRPFVVSTKSLSGLQALTDLSRPTVEVSEQGISTYTFQPGLVCWSDHLLGFIDVWPATMVGGTTIGFAHVEHYCHMRHVADVSAPPTCCAVGTQHPFVLVGAADGTLVCVNPAARVFRSRTTRAFKVTVFQHDHVGTTVSKNGTMDGSSEQRLSKGPSRGAARIVHGFAPQINEHNKAEKMRRLMQELRRKAQKGRDQNRASDRRRRQRGRQPHQGSGGHPESRPIAVDADDAPGDVKMSDVVDTHDSGHARTEQAPHPKAVVEPVIFEPLTRVTCVAWNPNAEYGWWAAAALGSGLVKVMDLGDETPAENNW